MLLYVICWHYKWFPVFKALKPLLTCWPTLKFVTTSFQWCELYVSFLVSCGWSQDRNFQLTSDVHYLKLWRGEVNMLAHIQVGATSFQSVRSFPCFCVMHALLMLWLSILSLIGEACNHGLWTVGILNLMPKPSTCGPWTFSKVVLSKLKDGNGQIQWYS